MKTILILSLLLLSHIGFSQTAWHSYVTSQTKVSSDLLNSKQALASSYSEVMSLIGKRDQIFDRISRPQNPPPSYSSNLHEAVSYYSIWYDKINNPLRAGQKPIGNAFRHYKELTSIDFNRLISAVGVVFRGVSLPRKVYQNLESTKTFQDLAIMSASLKPIGARAYIENCTSSSANECVFMILNSKRSKYISYLSDLPREEEVLFTPNTSFKVKKILKETGRGFAIVFLDEI